MATARNRRDPDPQQGVYMISVAAELAGMHPQTLRIYEARGLITPKRSRATTRLTSRRAVGLRRPIRGMTAARGMNPAGSGLVLGLERDLRRMRPGMCRWRRGA